MCILVAVTRRYELKRRAERQDETRQRIVDATIELHQTIGAAQTTVSEIAKRAGVGRVTVYRHFPDEETLFYACSGHYFSQHPFPDIERWRRIPDPHERLREGLRETYAWHEENRQMIAMALAEARGLPLMAPYHDFLGRRREGTRGSVACSRSAALEPQGRDRSRPQFRHASDTDSRATPHRGPVDRADGPPG